MNKQEFEQAKSFICADIEREIALAKASQNPFKRLLLRIAGVPSGGANFMAALALLSYTEFAGRLKNNDFSDSNSRKNFDDFFGDLGQDYKQFLATHSVYKIFRCGLAHEYYVKKDCVIAMQAGSSVRTGVRFDATKYFFVIEKYFEDFKIAFSGLGNKVV